MNELKTYLEASEKLKSDEALMRLIDTYESETKQLLEMVQKPDYDAQEAIRLTNDVEYMSDQISKNELYRTLWKQRMRLKRCCVKRQLYQ